MTAIIGVDPGQTTGIALIDTDGAIKQRGALVQANRYGSLTSVWALARAARDEGADVLIAVEKFVAGPRSSKLATPAGAETTRLVIGEVTTWAAAARIPVVQRSAAEVKPWATDERLQRARLFAKGMRHANDAARHALYAAVKDAGLPDPLSRSARSPRRTTP